MSKQQIPLLAEDISAFSRALSAQLEQADAPPSHLSLMNNVARAAGFRNFQHLRAAHKAGERLANDASVEVVDHRLVEKALSHFDAQGRLERWPKKRKMQTLCLWVFWASLPLNRLLHEREVNEALCLHHTFGDPALLRRSLFSDGLVTRNLDGSDYQRQERRPPAEARALFRLLAARRQTG